MAVVLTRFGRVEEAGSWLEKADALGADATTEHARIAIIEKDYDLALKMLRDRSDSICFSLKPEVRTTQGGTAITSISLATKAHCAKTPMSVSELVRSLIAEACEHGLEENRLERQLAITLSIRCFTGGRIPRIPPLPSGVVLYMDRIVHL